MVVLTKVQILTNEMDGGQYPVGVPWFLKHSDVCYVAEELHLIRHLGAGGEEMCPGREDSSEEVPTDPLRLLFPGSSTESPCDAGHAPREMMCACVCACVCMCVHMCA